MSARAYHFVRRTSATGPVLLVFDRADRLHVPLTAFARRAVRQVTVATAMVYLHAILPFVTYIETDEWQCRAGIAWNSPPDLLRRAVDDYLTGRLRCMVREHRHGFQLVTRTSNSDGTVRVLLSALKSFYRIARREGFYLFDDPFIDSTFLLKRAAEEEMTSTDHPPRMPAASGVEPPHHDPRRKWRLSDSYYKLTGERWTPQGVDDVTFPQQVLAGGRRRGWRSREVCVTRLLFETGARVSEITGLTLGDWHTRGLMQEATSFSKGSCGRRVKFLRFQHTTAKLLRRYFDTERLALDPTHRTLSAYVRSAKHEQVDLYQVPLFLTTQRTPLTPKTYRELYWNPACHSVHIDADVHQARHWYVTQAVRQIYETSHAEGETQRRLRELIAYMAWRGGWETMQAYEHYFDPIRHAEVQDAVHRRMNEAMQDRLRTAMTPDDHNTATVARTARGVLKLVADPVTTDTIDSDFDFLRSIGGFSE